MLKLALRPQEYFFNTVLLYSAIADEDRAIWIMILNLLPTTPTLNLISVSALASHFTTTFCYKASTPTVI